VASEQKIVVIGASAGGVEALTQVVRHLPKNLAAPVFVVLHIPPDATSVLPDILARNGRLRAKAARDGERYENGTIYVAPPDFHLLVNDGTLRLRRGPRENRVRPSVDPLFRSAAIAAGPHAIGVILTGSLDDGTAGLIAIKQRGGTAIIQDPKDAVYPGMPQSALEHVDADVCVPLSRISEEIVNAVNRPVVRPRPRAVVTEDMEMEKKIAEMDSATMQDDNRPGEPSAFSCPECGGVLWEIKDGEYVRFRCRVGHGYSPETMLGAQSEQLEAALWSAMKTLEESARLSRRLADSERARGHDWMVERFEERERDARDRAEVIRQFLMSQSTTVPIESPREQAEG
jgi:two-component system, chemotaxis family, protein-glutamate methylesterase/glutaminase